MLVTASREEVSGAGIRCGADDVSGRVVTAGDTWRGSCGREREGTSAL